MKKLINGWNFSVLGLLVFLTSGCYSFKSGRIPDNIETINIKFFPNRAAVVQPSLSQIFTDKLKDKFVSESRLNLITTHADLNFEGYISDYTNTPNAIQNSQQAALNRLTISVFVKFTNAKDPKQDFETTFTRFAEYNSSLSFQTVETNLIQEINRLLIDDIYNKSVTNW
ncbi:MAG: LptE family protein [Bacteroidia bacterium]|nr:LptE family protein [Bacteroidia bacterium]HQV00107.1 LptE family protein [Bacteroidia bacterium]